MKALYIWSAFIVATGMIYLIIEEILAWNIKYHSDTKSPNYNPYHSPLKVKRLCYAADIISRITAGIETASLVVLLICVLLQEVKNV